MVNKTKPEGKKGKCTNCGKAMEQVSNENWSVYCTKKSCQKAMLKAIYGEELI